MDIWKLPTCREKRLTEKIRGPGSGLGVLPHLGLGVRCSRSQQKRGSGHGSKRKPGMLACWKSSEEAHSMILICSSVK